MSAVRDLFRISGPLSRPGYWLGVILLVIAPSFMVLWTIVGHGNLVGYGFEPFGLFLIPVIMLAWLCGRRSEDIGSSAATGWFWTMVCAFAPILIVIGGTMALDDISKRFGFPDPLTWDRVLQTLLLSPPAACGIVASIYGVRSRHVREHQAHR